jgi:general secretion pathway protein B
MSYILNALRKSEQERQAKQPETITDQVLMPPAPKSRKTAVLIGGLLAVNLLVLPVLIWYLNKADDAPANPQARTLPLQQKAVQKPRAVAAKPIDAEMVSEPGAVKEPTEAATPAQVAVSSSRPGAGTPSLEELAVEGKAAKHGRPQKSENGAQSVSPSPAISQQPAPKKESPARRVHGVVAAKSLNDADGEVDKKAAIRTETAPAESQEIPLFKDLPYNFRNSAPNMTVNVFMYATNPEDRFVVMNMTKYKAGQTTKEAVEIKEIRSDGIIASYGGKVFRIERP